METKNDPPRPARAPSNNMDIFDNPSPAPQHSHNQNLDPFAMDSGPTRHPTQNRNPEPEQDIFSNSNARAPQQMLDPFDLNSGPAPAPVTHNNTNNQDDLDIFFGTSGNQPTMHNQPQVVPQRNPNAPVMNKNDVSGFSVYNQLNTSNMKDMSAMGINNFIDINKDNGDKNEAPKFDLRDEPSGTIFDGDNQDNTQK
jgi:hypothetical protein